LVDDVLDVNPDDVTNPEDDSEVDNTIDGTEDFEGSTDTPTE